VTEVCFAQTKPLKFASEVNFAARDISQRRTGQVFVCSNKARLRLAVRCGSDDGALSLNNRAPAVAGLVEGEELTQPRMRADRSIDVFDLIGNPAASAKTSGSLTQERGPGRQRG
jgi:hypothetical protein